MTRDVNDRVQKKIDYWNSQPPNARKLVFASLEMGRDKCLALGKARAEQPNLAPLQAAKAFDALIALVEQMAMEKSG